MNAAVVIKDATNLYPPPADAGRTLLVILAIGVFAAIAKAAWELAKRLRRKPAPPIGDDVLHFSAPPAVTRVTAPPLPYASSDGLHDALARITGGDSA